MLHADEVGHGGERGRAEHAGHQVVGPLPRLAPAAVGHRDERGCERLELPQRPHQRGLLGVVLGREELEGVGRAPGQHVRDPGHGRDQPTGGLEPRPPAALPASAARTVLRRSMARVMGPTPPMRGVIQPATSLTASSTSESSVRPRHDVPAPTTAAPGFTMSGVTNPADPAAATTTSPLRTRPARSATPVWTTVTAALQPGRLSASSSARGRPIVSPRPMTTTWRPSTGTS